MLFEFSQGEGDLTWPEIAPVAVEVAYALEKLANDSLGIDLHKYNLKMRSLDFNVKVISHPLFPHSHAKGIKYFLCCFQIYLRSMITRHILITIVPDFYSYIYLKFCNIMCIE